MSKVSREQLMDAAERRIRDGGYDGFSFRDLAADTGIRSASVHHHFPTKQALGAAVARRYAERVHAAVNADVRAGLGTVAAWRAVFRRALLEDGRMCLCGVLGAGLGAVPPEVATEVRTFFTLALASLAEPGAPGAVGRDAAFQVMATLEGAMLLARSLGEPAAFDRATAALI